MVIAAFLAGGADTSAAAADRSAQEIADMLPAEALQALERNPGQVRKQALARVYALSPDGVATEDMIQAEARARRAQARASRLSAFFEYDLDGDGGVSQQEFAQLAPQLPPGGRERTRAYLAEADADRDGFVSYAEAVGRIDRDLDAAALHSPDGWSLMALDMDGDGRVDASEALRAIDAVAELMRAEALARGGTFARSSP